MVVLCVSLPCRINFKFETKYGCPKHFSATHMWIVVYSDADCTWKKKNFVIAHKVIDHFSNCFQILLVNLPQYYFCTSTFIFSSRTEISLCSLKRATRWWGSCQCGVPGRVSCTQPYTRRRLLYLNQCYLILSHPSIRTTNFVRRSKIGYTNELEC